jgi:hypothetical protein
MELGSFWIWWSLTVLACSWPLLRALDHPREVLGFPLIASLMWLYLYVYLPFQAVTYLDDALKGLPLSFAQFLSCASFACLLLGWYLRVGGGSTSLPRAARYHLGKLWLLGIGWLVVGNVGLYSFLASGASYQSSSAYWYMLNNVGYAGTALCVVALVRGRRYVDPLSVLLVIVLIGLLAGPFIVGARRGPMFTAIIAVIFAYLLASRTMPRLSVAVGTLAFTGFMMLVLVEVRNYTYHGKTWDDALETMTFEDVMAKRTKKLSDNEFVNHCVQIQANLETDQYQYGTSILSALLSWIPRSLWPDKPVRNEGWFTEARDYFRSGVRTNLGSGGAWGTVADAFNNFWYFSLVFWFAVGWFTAAVYTKGQRGGDLSWKMYYLGILMATHWFIAQCLSEAIVPWLMYEAVFWLSFRLCRLPAMPFEPMVVSSQDHGLRVTRIPATSRSNGKLVH